jgi:hypothetical protein
VNLSDFPPISVSTDILRGTQSDLLQEMMSRQVKALDQEQWSFTYTGRSWFNDLSYEWAGHAAVMCDADEIDFGDPLLAPLGACDHPYDISKPCALRTWEHYKPTDEEVAQWWSAQ